MGGSGRSVGLAAEALEIVGQAVPGVVWDRVDALGHRPGKATVFVVADRNRRYRVVAKLQAANLTALEVRAYQTVSALANLPTVTCLGAQQAAGDPLQAWLLTQFAGGARFDQDSRSHRGSLGAWIAAVHRHAPSVADPSDFPDHGAEYWLSVLREAVSTLDAGLGNPALERADARGLGALRALFTQVQDRWESMVGLMSALPATLTHGDLVPQNITIVMASPREVPLVIDWGHAGWGSPVIDLLWVRANAYARQVGVERGAVCRMRALGSVLWTAFVLAGDRVNLSSPWPQRAAYKVAAYVEALKCRGAQRLGGGGS